MIYFAVTRKKVSISSSVQPAAGSGYSVFVHSNGHVSTIGGNSYNKNDVGEWRLFG